MRFLVLVFITTLALSIKASAEQYLTCNTCINQFQMHSVARSAAEGNVTSNGYTDDIFVANFKTAQISGWRISVQYSLNNNGEIDVVSTSSPVSVPSDLQAKVDDASRNEVFALKKVFVPGESGFTSAWDIARNTSNRERLDDWFHDNHPVSYWLSTLGVVLAGHFYNPINGLEYIFEFEDGSTLIMTAPHANQAKLRLDYKENSSSDVDGNMISDAGESFSGEYTFNSVDSMNDYINRASMYGVRVVNVSVGAGARTYYVVILEH
ncbi:hypothetical protein P2G88_00250 [Aliiglaciecola sp. CAU 1673]|uniref:hypothetical protein n=1 Tax=Aliiglaciecola sp. CAU 1673 TaxID=3032595 RepID=UPI0023DC60CB|nr:hypothetical protein [Aliiglaciecola sp. CAU 1673]MDF2176677.1 hypothetical protein [Aliiglaciecola sp. CAU 1673]